MLDRRILGKFPPSVNLLEQFFESNKEGQVVVKENAKAPIAKMWTFVRKEGFVAHPVYNTEGVVVKVQLLQLT